MFGTVGLGLKLLGLGSKIKDFIKAYWKIILPILITVGLYFYHINAISNAKDEGISIGITQEAKRINNIIAKQDEKNRNFESNLNKDIVEIDKKLTRENSKRQNKEIVYRDRIKTEIVNNPIYQECKVEPSIVDSINNIRKLGPDKEISQ
jgi:hypothetical protein